MKPLIITRLTYNEIFPKLSKPTDILKIIDEIFNEYEPTSLRTIIVKYLAKFNNYAQKSDPSEFYNLLENTSKDYFRSGYKAISKKHGFPVIVTRQNMLFVLKHTFSKTGGKKKITNINQIGKSLLKLNCFEDELLEPLKDTVITTDFLESIISDLFRTNFHNEKSKIILSEIVRNYELVEEILTTPEGIEADNLLKENEGISIKEKILTCYMVYLWLTSKYNNNNYENIIDLEVDFKQFGDAAIKLRKSFSSFFESFNLDINLSNIDHKQINNNYSIWLHPIEKLSDTKYRILDLGILIERIFRNTFLELENNFLNSPTLKDEKRNLDLRNNALGKCFEDSVNSFIQNNLNIQMFKNTYEDNNEITDIILKIDDNIIFIEIKAGYIPITKLSGNFTIETFKELLLKYGLKYPGKDEYSKLPNNHKKGTLQLLRLNEKIYEGIDEKLWKDNKEFFSSAKNIYNIVLTQEAAVSINYLNLLIHKNNLDFIEKISTEDLTFHTPIIIHISDLYKVHNGNINLSEALYDYSQSLLNNTPYSFIDFINDRYNNPSYLSHDVFSDFNEIAVKYFGIQKE